MKRIMMTLAVAATGMTAMMAQSHEVTTTDKNGNKVVYEISDAAATKGDTLSITTFDPQSVAKSDSINRASREENYELTKEDIRTIMREMDIDTDWVPTALGGMILGGIICVVLPIVIVAAVLLYRYYSRKKKYELAQKILESGQPLPDNFLNELKEEYREDSGWLSMGIAGVILSVLFGIFLPLIIIVAVLLYRYYSRKKKYELAQKIVESGQPLPENFAKAFEEDYNREEDRGLYEKGVKNIAIGIALSIFLFLMTHELFLACIGLFVVANGVSQVLAYNHRKGINYRENSKDTYNTNFND